MGDISFLQAQGIALLAEFNVHESTILYVHKRKRKFDNHSMGPLQRANVTCPEFAKATEKPLWTQEVATNKKA